MNAFEEYLVAAFPKDVKRTRKVLHVIHQEFVERIISLLKNSLRIVDRKFRNLVE